MLSCVCVVGDHTALWKVQYNISTKKPGTSGLVADTAGPVPDIVVLVRLFSWLVLRWRRVTHLARIASSLEGPFTE